MDYREKVFKAKFKSAGQHLGVTPDQVISLKLRDNVSSYDEYHEMLKFLEHEAGLHWLEVDGNFQGRGYLVDNNDQKIIVVEHETGLEILYIAGSIASLIGLVPLVLQAWGAIRGYLDRHRAHNFRGVEIRRLDSKGKLSEDYSRGLAGPSVFPLSVLNTALLSAARILDADMHESRQEIRSLSKRLAAIEKKLKPTKKATTKKSTKKSRYNKGREGRC